ncbi:MAG: hypothetical protein JWN03_1499 [Nocardia sp.]|nr:hypothetical protein [Nocardia sp.]
MVAVVQLVEHQVVILDVAGSSPVGHPSEEAPVHMDRGLFSSPEVLSGNEFRHTQASDE